MPRLDTRNCACHGEPAYWQIDRRVNAGGWWECAVKRRDRERERYDRDWRYRIGKTMKANGRKRRETIERRRANGGTVQG